MSSLEFNDLSSFLTHLAVTERAIQRTTTEALDRAARLIQQDARKRIGKYQDAVGPFQDWAELAESTQEERARLGYPANEPLLREGDLRNSIQREVVGDEAVIGSKSDIAAYQEFGTSRIPPRPFIGPAAYANRAKIERILGLAVVQGLAGGSVIHAALGYDMDLSGKGIGQ